MIKKGHGPTSQKNLAKSHNSQMAQFANLDEISSTN